MQIFAKTCGGSTTTLEVDPSDTIGDAKAMIEEKDGIPPHFQTLIYGGEMLENGLTFADYELSEGTSVTLIIRPPAMLQIAVETESGATHSLEVLSSDTVAAVKDMVFEAAEDGASHQHSEQFLLVFKGKQLKDECSLNHYGVLRESTLRLVSAAGSAVEVEASDDTAGDDTALIATTSDLPQ